MLLWNPAFSKAGTKLSPERQRAESVRQSVQRGLRWRLLEGRQEVRAVYQGPDVDSVLHIKVDPASADISNFSGEVLAKRMLHTQVPVDGVRPLRVRRDPVGSIGAGRRLVEDADPAASAGQSAAREKVLESD